jgi:hypothetical protein
VGNASVKAWTPIANYFAMNGLYSGPPEVMGLARKRENILPAEEAE